MLIDESAEEKDLCRIMTIVPEKFGDHCGFFSKTSRYRILKRMDLNANFFKKSTQLHPMPERITIGHQTPHTTQTKVHHFVYGAIFDAAEDV